MLRYASGWYAGFRIFAIVCFKYSTNARLLMTVQEHRCMRPVCACIYTSSARFSQELFYLYSVNDQNPSEGTIFKARNCGSRVICFFGVRLQDNAMMSLLCKFFRARYIMSSVERKRAFSYPFFVSLKSFCVPSTARRSLLVFFFSIV